MKKYKNVAISRINDKYFKIGEVVSISAKSDYEFVVRGNMAINLGDTDFIFMFNVTDKEIDKVVNSIITEPTSSIEKELRTDYQKFSSKLKELEELKTTEDYDNANLNPTVKEIYRQDNEAMDGGIDVLKTHLDLVNRMAKLKGINLNEE